jgi:HSP20 family protein
MTEHDKFFSLPLRLPKELDRLFDELIHRPWGVKDEFLEWNPSVDVYETEEAFIVEADLPGMKHEDVKVEVKENSFLLRGRRSSEQRRSNERFYCRERSFGGFSRQMALPEPVDKNKFKAEFSDGVLRVILPKLKRKAGPS